jgi:translation initiation factor IF-2
MAAKGTKLFKIASQINIGRDAIVEYLVSKGFDIANKATAVLTDEMVEVVIDKFAKELKTAEKQREKVARHAAVRKNLMEGGTTVSIDTLADKSERDHQVAELIEAQAEAAHERVEEAPVAEAAEVETEKKGPKVGEVIDLDAIGKKPPVEEPAAPEVEQPVAEQKAPADEAPDEKDAVADADVKEDEARAAPEATEEEPAHGEEKRKRKRKGVIEVELKSGSAPRLKGLTVLGKIDVSKKEERPSKKPKQKTAGRGGRNTIGDQIDSAAPGAAAGDANKTRGRGVRGPAEGGTEAERTARRKKGKGGRETFSDTDVSRAIRRTLSGLEDRGTSSGRAKIRQRKRAEREEKEAIRQEERQRDSATLRLSEFVTTGDLANLMGVSAADVIMKCMGLGLMVSVNQRLDKETIEVIASDYNYEVEFLDDQTEQEFEDFEDDPETLQPRSPIVTIMGHVDHGKTSLLDYIRAANVVAGEAGGITQHIGAYRVEVPDGRHITFLDTPGHEAFTAMRARGAQVTDIVVLVVAADDSVMPQTIEAISHAQAANVPIVVAINKVDRPEANPDKIKQQLSDHNVLVEEWGGKVQAVQLSAKTGANVDQLLEKILLEADLLDLQANPDRAARATVIEAHVDKGRGNVVTVIVQKGTLDVGDIFVCGQFAGRVRAMADERGNRVDSAGPSIPVQVSGFDGLPNAGDVLIEMETDAEARDIANRRQQLRREQQFRGMRHMTLDDISAQIQKGGVKELRLIVKADVSGSLEALSDSLIKLSTEEVQVRIIYRSVGAVSESDVMLASASDAIIVGFQVNVPPAVRKTAEEESVDVRLYSIIYDCINEIQLALEGLLTPDIKEEITATIEVRQTFKISKLGTIAGCYVTDGSVNRNDRVRVLRDGFETFKGTISSLKRIKEDVREVASGYECGISINGFNDIAVGDIIEAYKTIEVKRKLSDS